MLDACQLELIVLVVTLTEQHTALCEESIWVHILELVKGHFDRTRGIFEVVVSVFFLSQKP